MKRCIAFLLALMLCCLTMAVCAEFIVGADIPEGDIRNFYVIGVLKAIRNRLGKGNGDFVHVVILEAGGEKT